MASHTHLIAIGVLLVGIAATAIAYGAPAPPTPGCADPQAEQAAQHAAASLTMAPGSNRHDDGAADLRRLPAPAASVHARASVVGRVALPADGAPAQSIAFVDAAPIALRGADRSQFGSDDLEAGEHRLVVAWLTAEPRLQVVTRTFVVAAGERLDLGTLTVTSVTTGAVRVRADAEPAPPTARLELQPGSWLSLPLGQLVPVDGLPAAGLPVRVRATDGPAWASRMGRLVPGQTAELLLSRRAAAALDVVASWPTGLGWVEINVVAGGDEVSWARVAGTSSAAARLDTRTGPVLVVASHVDRTGATLAFAARSLELDGPQRLELDLQPTVAASGRWPTPTAGESAPIRIALAAWPDRDLWRSTVSADGTFRFAGVPVDAPLLARRGVGAQRPMVLRAERDGWSLVPTPD